MSPRPVVRPRDLTECQISPAQDVLASDRPAHARHQAMEKDQRSRPTAEPGAWVAWHDAYDRPRTGLARRLAVVRRRIGEVLDVAIPGAAAASGPLRILGLCAGDGRAASSATCPTPTSGRPWGR